MSSSETTCLCYSSLSLQKHIPSIDWAVISDTVIYNQAASRAAVIWAPCMVIAHLHQQPFSRIPGPWKRDGAAEETGHKASKWSLADGSNDPASSILVSLQLVGQKPQAGQKGNRSWLLSLPLSNGRGALPGWLGAIYWSPLLALFPLKPPNRTGVVICGPSKPHEAPACRNKLAVPLLAS